MSIVYSYYIGARNKETGIVRFVAPYLNKKDDTLKPYPITATREGLDCVWELPEYLIDEKDREIFGYYDYNDEYRSYSRWTRLNELVNEDILIEGYLPLEELRMLKKTDRPVEFIHYEMPKPLPADYVAELPNDKRKEYGHIAVIDILSQEYTIHKILNFATNLEYYKLDEDEEYVVVEVWT